MIYYFTSTGNCEYTARRIADAVGETTCSINEIREITIAAGEMLGFVFPTYFWALPSYVEGIMRQVKITSSEPNPYTFFVATYGSTCGAAGKIMKRHMARVGVPLTAAFSVKMPDDWTPWFDLSDSEKVAAQNAAAEPLIDEIIAQVRERRAGDMLRDTKPEWMNFFSLKMYESYRKTKNFRLEAGCIGCGKCAAECPEHAIEIREGHPVWVKEKCTLCLHCLHTCPAFAIQYKGDGTKAHGQYHHKNFEKK